MIILSVRTWVPLIQETIRKGNIKGVQEENEGISSKRTYQLAERNDFRLNQV